MAAGPANDARGEPLKISAFFPRQVRKLLRAVRQARRAVLADAHPEAIHDLRVSIRRLRSVLRSVRGVYGRFHVDAISAELKRVTEGTNALRDAEVLQAYLGSLSLGPRAADAVQRWLADHRRQARAVRESIERDLGANPSEHAFAQLRALLRLPVRPSRDREAEALAIVCVARECRRLFKICDGGLDVVHDVDRLHRARIVAKRLRYMVEFYRPVLPRPLHRLARAARAIQTHLGDLHDLDVLMQHIDREPDLAMSARTELLLRLADQRAAGASLARASLARAFKILRAVPLQTRRTKTVAP